MFVKDVDGIRGIFKFMNIQMMVHYNAAGADYEEKYYKYGEFNYMKDHISLKQCLNNESCCEDLHVWINDSKAADKHGAISCDVLNAKDGYIRCKYGNTIFDVSIDEIKYHICSTCQTLPRT